MQHAKHCPWAGLPPILVSKGAWKDAHVTVQHCWIWTIHVLRNLIAIVMLLVIFMRHGLSTVVSGNKLINLTQNKVNELLTTRNFSQEPIKMVPKCTVFVKMVLCTVLVTLTLKNVEATKCTTNVYIPGMRVLNTAEHALINIFRKWMGSVSKAVLVNQAK